MELEIAIGLVLLVALIFLATVDMAFAYVSDIGLRRLSTEIEETGRSSSSTFLREIIENRPRFRFALSSAIQILVIGFTVLVTISVSRYLAGGTQQLLAGLLIALTATVVFRQIIPRLFVRHNTERKLIGLLPIVRPLYRVAWVLTTPLSAMFPAREPLKLDATHTPDHPEERPDDNADDFHALMEVGEAEGIIEEKERELIESMVEFNVTRAGEIMTPRTEICALSVDATVAAARDLIVDEKYSRLPVYRETIDNIEGVIYVRDLLQAWAEDREDQPIRSMLREAFFVPETKGAAELLRAMQTNHVQLAIVIDEYGGVAGIVTVEDILEEIVGEIEDEDIENEEIIEIIEGADGYFDVLGSTEIDKIERILGVEIADDDFTTIAGMVTSRAGYVPKAGEELEMDGIRFEVLRADEKKITLLRIRRLSTEAEA